MRACPICPAEGRSLPEGGFMSTLPAVTMQDLEFEHADNDNVLVLG
jgi:hypothetical protein